MKKLISMFLLVLTLLGTIAVASGCSSGPEVGPVPSTEVKNPFTAPPAQTTETASAQATEPAPSQETPIALGSGLEYFEGKPELHQGDLGYYIQYDGGEMHFPFEFGGKGAGLVEYGMGFVLFLDGIPQPYRTSENEEYRYMHIFKMQDQNTPVSDEFIFAPITGKKGDLLELNIASIEFPECYKTTKGNLRSTDWVTTAGGRFLMNADPPAQELPVRKELVKSYSATLVDLSEEEIRGWTPDDLKNKIEQHFYVNRTQDYGVIKGISTDDKVTLRFELWGCPSAQCAVVMMVDNEPLYVEPEQIQLSTKYGQKTIVEVELDMSHFDGRMYAYALLIPRNMRSMPDRDASVTISPNSQIFLTD